jgi:Spy/CpxP family protein refolding chaperone
MINVEGKSVWQIRAATLGVLALGFVVGVLALQSYNNWFGAVNQPTKKERYEEAFNKLGLTEAQKSEIQKTVQETREKLQSLRQESEPRVQEIRAQNDEKLQRILSPEQWQKFQREREIIRQSEKPPNN